MMRKLLTAAVMFAVAGISAGTLKFECSVNSKDAIFKAGKRSFLP